MVVVVDEQHDVEAALFPLETFYPILGTLLIFAERDSNRGGEHFIVPELTSGITPVSLLLVNFDGNCASVTLRRSSIAQGE